MATKPTDESGIMSIEYSDRYTALGIEAPPPSETCKGFCEGTGVVPVYLAEGDARIGNAHPHDETDRRLVALWREVEDESKAEDGWHFVKCPDCGGSGRR